MEGVWRNNTHLDKNMIILIFGLARLKKLGVHSEGCSY